MVKTLEAHEPPVLVEAPSPETTTFMASLGYTAYAYDRRANRLVPLTEPVTNVLFARSLPPGTS
jgi:hypothetical protein